jgi:hypothetical protein
VQLRLALAFASVGHVGSALRTAFEETLVRDLATATGVEPATFRITQVSAGSVVVDLEISVRSLLALLVHRYRH